MAGNKNSQYDHALIVKEVHDFHGQALRVADIKSVADKSYSHFRATYNVNNLPTIVNYFQGLTSHITLIGCLADISGSLNNKYLTIRNNPDDNKYHIWFNVNSAGIDPAPSSSIGIEIPIDTNDPSNIVSTAITLIINSLFNSSFTASRTGSVVEIRTVGMGLITSSTDFNTGFSISNTLGTQEVTNSVNISYVGLDPVYKGQLLSGYQYNIFTGQFEKVGESVEGVKPESLRFDEVSSTLYYLGEAPFGALTSESKWKIKKIDTSTGVIITSASVDFDQIWDNRTGLTYV